jgi:hypothetical protein
MGVLIAGFNFSGKFSFESGDTAVMVICFPSITPLVIEQSQRKVHRL